MKRISVLLILCFAHFSCAKGINSTQSVRPAFLNNIQQPDDAKSMINYILDHISWRANFIIEEKKGVSAYATIINGERYIFYDNEFLTNLDRKVGTKWASISVLAHEMGHHYLNHVFSSAGSNPTKELEADDFSGYVLAKLGVTLNEATAAIRKIAAVHASTIYPSRLARIDAITTGWNYEKGNTNTANNLPAPQPQLNPPLANNSSAWINLYLYGNNDMEVYLSDDGKKYNPASLKTSQPFVFKFEINNYGFLRFTDNAKATVYKLYHGKDYAIIWDRKNNNWTVVSVN